MVTKHHRDALRARRNHLKAGLHLTPNNVGYSRLVYAQDVKRERQIKKMEKSLKQASNKFKRNFSNARLQGKLRTEFNKQRLTKKRSIKQEMKR